MTSLRFLLLFAYASPALAGCERLTYHWQSQEVISGLVANLKLIWLIPTNLFFNSLENGLPDLYRFFEVDCSTGYGAGGILFSLLCWFVLGSALYSVGKRINHIDTDGLRREKGYED
jgi:hypothetical protein